MMRIHIVFQRNPIFAGALLIKIAGLYPHNMTSCVRIISDNIILAGRRAVRAMCSDNQTWHSMMRVCCSFDGDKGKTPSGQIPLPSTAHKKGRFAPKIPARRYLTLRLISFKLFEVQLRVSRLRKADNQWYFFDFLNKGSAINRKCN